MRPARGWMMLGLLLAASGPVRAGLYNTSEPEQPRAGKAEEINRFRESLFRLRSLGYEKVEIDNPMRKRYFLQADLAGRSAPPSLTVEEKLNLSEVLLRRNRPGEALQFLMGLAREAPDNPLVQSNLATAYHQSGELRPASDTMEAALAEGSKSWASSWSKLGESQQKFLQAAGWSENYDQYRKAEKLYAKLLKRRYRETLRKEKTDDEPVDALFDDGKSPASPVRFVNSAGVFEPGKVALAEKAKIPADAIDLVQQLLLWLPHDFRLFRLLGELYNARGTPADVRAAELIFDELIRNKYAPGDLVERHKLLQQAVAQLPDPNADIPFEEMVGKVQKQEDQQELPFDFKSLAIAFGFGFLVALFTVWQVRELRRRQLARHRPPVPPVPPSPHEPLTTIRPGAPG